MISETTLRETIARGAEQWRTKNKELLSCFDSEKLFETMGALNELEPDTPFGEMLKSKIAYGVPNKRNIMLTVVSEQIDEVGVIEQGIELSFDKVFLTLWDRGALNSLLVVEEIPAQAQHDLDRIAARVEASRPKARVPAAAPPPPADPVDMCVRDFHEMGSKEFQRKYLSDTRMRVHYENAISQGRI